MGIGSFTDFNFADDVALLVEMLSVNQTIVRIRIRTILALEIMNEEAQPLGLTINWSKTKI